MRPPPRPWVLVRPWRQINADVSWKAMEPWKLWQREVLNEDTPEKTTHGTQKMMVFGRWNFHFPKMWFLGSMLVLWGCIYLEHLFKRTYKTLSPYIPRKSTFLVLWIIAKWCSPNPSRRPQKSRCDSGALRYWPKMMAWDCSDIGSVYSHESHNCGSMDPFLGSRKTPRKKLTVHHLKISPICAKKQPHRLPFPSIFRCVSSC